MRRSTYFQIRVTQEELEQIKLAASKLGVSASDYARMRLLPDSSALLSGDEEKYFSVAQNTSNFIMSKYKVESATSEV